MTYTCIHAAPPEKLSTLCTRTRKSMLLYYLFIKAYIQSAAMYIMKKKSVKTHGDQMVNKFTDLGETLII